jgi:hypothetical protein
MLGSLPRPRRQSNGASLPGRAGSFPDGPRAFFLAVEARSSAPGPTRRGVDRARSQNQGQPRDPSALRRAREASLPSSKLREPARGLGIGPDLRPLADAKPRSLTLAALQVPRSPRYPADCACGPQSSAMPRSPWPSLMRSCCADSCNPTCDSQWLRARRCRTRRWGLVVTAAARQPRPVDTTVSSSTSGSWLLHRTASNRPRCHPRRVWSDNRGDCR